MVTKSKECNAKFVVTTAEEMVRPLIQRFFWKEMEVIILEMNLIDWLIDFIVFYLK